MSTSIDNATDYRGSFPRTTQEVSDWQARAPHVDVLEPELPIVDAHHHLFGSPEDTVHYRLEDLREDIAGGHRLLGTVYIEAYESGWRKTGPEAMRPVGEVEMIVGLTGAPVQTPHGSCQVAAGIVSYVDLTLGDRVADVLEEQLKAAHGRLRGVRHRTATARWNGGRLHQGPAEAASPVRPRVQARLRPTRSIRAQLRCMDLPHATRRAGRPRGCIPEYANRAGPPRRAHRRCGVSREARRSPRALGATACVHWPPGRMYA